MDLLDRHDVRGTLPVGGERVRGENFAERCQLGIETGGPFPFPASPLSQRIHSAIMLLPATREQWVSPDDRLGHGRRRGSRGPAGSPPAPRG